MHVWLADPHTAHPNEQVQSRYHRRLFTQRVFRLGFKFSLPLSPVPRHACREKSNRDYPGRIRGGHGREAARIPYAAGATPGARRHPLWIGGRRGRPGDFRCNPSESPQGYTVNMFVLWISCTVTCLF